MGDGKLWVGIDAGLDDSVICVTGDDGAVLFEGAVESKVSAVQAVLAPLGAERVARIAIEAGVTVYLTRKLRESGLPVTLFDSRKVKRYLLIRRNKSDSNDARGLADVARLGSDVVSQVYLKSVECQHLRTQLGMRRKLIQQRVAGEAVIRSLLRLHGGKLPRVWNAENLSRSIKDEVRRIKREEGVDLEQEITPLLSVCVALREYQRQIDGVLRRRANSHPICKRFMEVPGVGPICALSFFSAIEDPNRFRRAVDVGGYLGLAPRTMQSGLTVRRYGITRMGNPLTRSHLVTSATILMSMSGHFSALKRWGDTLTRRIGKARARVAVARKLAVVLLAMWKNNEPFQPFRVGLATELAP